jgi:tetratricopeptide (TPR) repeat protein
MSKKSISGTYMHRKGLHLYYKEHDVNAALECFLIAALRLSEFAYGEIGSIYYCERRDRELAEYFFHQIDALELFSPMAAYHYSKFIYEEMEDYDTALTCLSWAADNEFEPAYEFIGSIFVNELNEIEEAEEWFERAKESEYQPSMTVHDYIKDIYFGLW